ncbi:cytokinin dehydrogenase 3-like [Apium graveolens]|uniref:cytokinin dehydrogenase 3-like n=1 Tax=Apium graveolens TaxID=4045 RepID=UPI003D7A0CF9
MSFIISSLISILGRYLKPLIKIKSSSVIPNHWSTLSCSLRITTNLQFGSDAIKMASTDFGNIITSNIPSAVLFPSHIDDIINLITLSYTSTTPFPIAARGHGHSVRGQATARDGVVVDMKSLNNSSVGTTVSWSSSLGFYADVGGEQLWIDVLSATLEHGLAPVSWTDYLYLTVGGTLSNAGMSGQAFCYGPQISNVHELDVITGKGEFFTCSKHINSELFYAVLGGLGQFGIITRARIVLDKAPKRVKWVRMLYHDFSAFTRDQEHLISIIGVDYVEGHLLMNQSSANNWRSSFFSPNDVSNISSLLSQHKIIYCLEVVKYYDDLTVHTIDKELKELLQGLSFNSGFMFQKDVTLMDFLNRVRSGELKLQSQGLWDVPHPWLNLFVPKSEIFEFHEGVIVNMIHARNITRGPVLLYPTNRKGWDDRMSAVTPDEDIFYSIGLLLAGNNDNWKAMDDQNNDILEFCEKAGIRVKQYLPHYTTRREWINHFGEKWNTFQERKTLFDPKMILSPGQRIFQSV